MMLRTSSDRWKTDVGTCGPRDRRRTSAWSMRRTGVLRLDGVVLVSRTLALDRSVGGTDGLDDKCSVGDRFPFGFAKRPLGRADLSAGPNLYGLAIGSERRLPTLLPLFQGGVDDVELLRCLTERESLRFAKGSKTFSWMHDRK